MVTNNYSIRWNFCASAPTFRCLDRVPIWFNSWNNDSCFYHSCHSSVLCVITSHTPLSLSPSNSRSNGRSSWTLFGASHPSCQWVLFCSMGSVDQGLNWHSELIGKINKFPHSLIVKCSDNVSVCLEKKLDKDIRDEQHLVLTQNEW